MSAETPLPPANWYPDPSGAGGQRYWDGDAWTDHTTPAQAPAPAAVGGVGVKRVVTDSDRKSWGVIAHLSSFVGALVVGLAVLGPLIVYLAKKDEDEFIREQAAESLNFQLSSLIYAFAGGLVLVLVTVVTLGVGLLVAIPVFLAAVIAWFVLVILASVAANRGERYRYPLTIRFFS